MTPDHTNPMHKSTTDEVLSRPAPDAVGCPDCAKARAKYDRLDMRMARRGNFGIVPLPQLCKRHLAEGRALTGAPKK